MADSICPTHYKRGSIEPWDFIRDQGLNYHLGNAIKYICRAGLKDSKADDLRKAIHYLQNELDHEIVPVNASPGVPGLLPDLQQQKSYLAQYTEDFDR